MLKTILSNWLIPAIMLTFVLVAVSFLAPGWAGVIAGAVFVLILSMAIFSAVRNQAKLYREKRISRNKMIRSVIYEITGILLGIILAALLGRYLAEIATEQISNSLTKFIVGMVIGLLAGMGAGFLMKQTWGRLAGS